MKNADGHYMSIGVPKRTENMDEREDTYISSLSLTNMVESVDDCAVKEKINLNIESDYFSNKRLQHFASIAAKKN